MNRKTDETADFNVTTSETSGQFGVGVLLKGIGPTSATARATSTAEAAVKARVEAATGSEWAVGKDETTLIPHKIRVYKFVQGSDRTVLNDRSAVYIAVDKDNYYYQDKVVPLSFTEEVLAQAKPARDTSAPSSPGCRSAESSRSSGRSRRGATGGVTETTRKTTRMARTSSRKPHGFRTFSSISRYLIYGSFGAGGICGSDMHYYRHARTGDFVVTSPLVLGHEIAGEVIEIGG